MQDDPVAPMPDTSGFTMLDERPADSSDRRRFTGFAVIVAAVLALLVVTAGRQRTVSGVAVVPPPAQIGDCLSISDSDPIWTAMNPDEVPSVDSAPCTGTRAGEVVSVDDQRAYSQGDCRNPAMGYLGIPAEFGPVEETGTKWITRSLVMTYTVGPSPLQVAAGQLWSACVVVGVDTQDFRPLPLAESPRGAATRGGAAFDPFAFCSDNGSGRVATPCGGPHRYEMIADGFDLGPSEADTLASCKATVARLTGQHDPTAGGRLRIELAAYLYDGGEFTPRKSTYQQARASGNGLTCTVAPTASDEMLTSTLIGLGERPLPIG